MKIIRYKIFIFLFIIIYLFTYSCDSLINGDTNPTPTPTLIDTNSPAEVIDLSIEAGSKQVTLYWIEPSDVDFEKVEVTFTPEGTIPIEVQKGTTTKIITGLTNGTEYTFCVKTVDITGNKSTGLLINKTPMAQWLTIFYDNFNRVNTSNGDLGNNLWTIFSDNFFCQVFENELRIARGPELPYPTTTIFSNSNISISSKIRASIFYRNETIVIGFSTNDFSTAYFLSLGGSEIQGLSTLGYRIDMTNYTIDQSDQFTSVADKVYKMVVSKDELLLTGEIYDGDIVVHELSGTLPSEFDFSNLHFFIVGGENTGFGSYVYVDDVVVEEFK